MRNRTPTAIEVQAERDRILFDIEVLEREIRSISEQLEDAEVSGDPLRQEKSDWWYRARDAKRHKERQRRILVARVGRLQRELGRIHPSAKKEEAKSAMREVLRTLFQVARTGLAFYEDDTEENETAFAEALDQLDQVVPGWDKTQERKPPKLKKLEMRPGSLPKE